MRQKRSGFSLVLSLAIMASMVMMVIVLAAFLQVETRLAQSHSGYMRARINAMAAAKIALGQLQQLAGPDQRVTMRADMYDAGEQPTANNSSTVKQTFNPSAPKDGRLSHQKRYWTGVWSTGGADSSKVRDWDVMNPHNSRLFLGWLCSPSTVSDSSNAFFEIAEYKKKPLPNYLPNRDYYTKKPQKDGIERNEILNPTSYEGQVLINELSDNISENPDAALIPLVSRGTVKIPSSARTRFAAEYYGQIDALPIPLPGPTSNNSSVTIGANGRYAFWIGDEGIKAKANLPDAYASVDKGKGYKNEQPNDWDDGLRGSAAQRNAIELITANDLLSPDTLPGFDFGSLRKQDILASTGWDTTTMSKVTNLNTLVLWATEVGSKAAGDTMKDATKALFHDVTALSYSTITDTYNGGIKLDLSTAFELPYAQYRGLEMYYGQKNPAVTPATDNRTTALFHNATNRSRPQSAGGSGGTADDSSLDINHPNYDTNPSYSSAKPSPAQLLKASPRAAEWAAEYVGKSFGGSRYGELVSQNEGEAPERVGFVYEVPLRSAFWNGVVFRINPFPTNSEGFNREIPKKDDANLNARIERGPTWDLYRNYYRMYKMEVEQCHKTSAIRGQDNAAFGDGETLFARGIEPRTDSTFQQSQPVNTGTKKIYFSKGPYGWFKNDDKSRGAISFYNNYSTAGNPGPQYLLHYLWDGKKVPKTLASSPNLPWPTSMKVAPSIIRFAYAYSTMWQSLPGYTGKVLGIAVDPFIVVHNPYDCAIEFPGITMFSSEREMTHVFQFYLNGVQIGDCYTGQTYSQSRPFTFRAIAGEDGNDKAFRLEPGEVQVITSIAGTTKKPFTELSGYNSVEIPGSFKKPISMTKTCMFFPMDPFARNVSMIAPKGTPTKDWNNPDTVSKLWLVAKKTSNSVIGVKDPKTSTVNTGSAIDPLGLTPSMTTTPRLLFAQTIGGKTSSASLLYPGAIPDWDGKDFSKLKTAGVGGKLKVKIFNNDGDSLGSSSTRGSFVFGERKYRGSGHIVDGGSQKWDFFMQYSKDYSGKALSPYRRWSGPVYESTIWKKSPTDLTPITLDPAFASLTDGSQSVYNMSGTDEPLLLSFRGLTAGWPAYGNAAESYSAKGPGTPDPEFPGTIVEGFRAYSTSLTLTDNGELQTVPVDSSKNFFFINDFFLRGGADCMISGTAIYPNDPDVPDKKMVTPTELRASPMSPFAFSSRAQLASYYSYDGKSHAPVGWVASQRNVDGSDLKIPYESKSAKGFWGTSALSKTGNSTVVLFSIPRRPLLSLSQFGSASISQDSANPDLSVGSSFAHPGIKDLNKICDWAGTKGGEFDSVNDPSTPEHGYAVKAESGGPSGTAKSVRGKATVRTDVAFASNLALWDSFWLSGLNAQEPSYADNAPNWPNGANLPLHTKVETMQKKSLDESAHKGTSKIDATTLVGIKDALDSGLNPLANKRVSYQPDVSKTDVNKSNGIFPDYISFPHPSYIGRHSLYNGGFNVNSTSKAAWKAVLGAMKTQKMPDGKVSTGTPLTRFARAFGGDNGAASPWDCYHDITDKELDDLADAVVNEVRRRGPFMSLSDFVNRRLVNDDNFGLKGALQAAIDATKINDVAISAAGGTFATVKGSPLKAPYFPIKASDRFPSARAMSKTNSDKKVIGGLGAPGIISQMDILNSVGPNLTARSDTFVIRAYGEAFDNNGNSIGKAWVEVVAQRTPEFLILTDAQARSLQISAEPNIRAPAYRDNIATASKSDYDAKPLVDMFQRNSPTDDNKDRLVNLNRILGRRFKSVSAKWLSQQDI